MLLTVQSYAPALPKDHWTSLELKAYHFVTVVFCNGVLSISYQVFPVARACPRIREGSFICLLSIACFSSLRGNLLCLLEESTTFLVSLL